MNRTIVITFSRQLRPQPPEGSTPYWWGLGDLSFQKDGKTVWHQEIPEASLFFNETFYNWLEVPRIYLSGCRVEFDDKWGWLLKFRVSHQEAHKVYEFLFKYHPEFKVSYYSPDEGTKITKKVPNMGVWKK